MQSLNKEYWNNRYLQQQTGWDLQEVSPPLKAYIDQLTNKQLRILIPGCGNAYEALYLAQQGFTDITLLDIAPAVVEQLKLGLQQYPQVKVTEGDFFKHNGSYDLVLEQTFFCALHPSLRQQYAENMHRLLARDGKLTGVLFNTVFDTEGPPFGGSAEEYKPLFEPFFSVVTFAPCYNSFCKREGTEIFIILEKKATTFNAL